MALPKSIGLRLFDDSFVPVLTEGEVKSKRVILTTVRDNQEKAYIELYEGSSDICTDNEYLGKLTIDINRATTKGEPGLEVNLRIDDDGVLYAKAWDQETHEESEIVIENTTTRTIIPETLSDMEIDSFSESTPQEIPAAYDDNQESFATHRYNENDESVYDSYQTTESSKNNLFLVLLLIGLLLILGLLSFLIVKTFMNANKQTNTKVATVSSPEEPKEEFIPEEPIPEEIIVEAPQEPEVIIEKPVTKKIIGSTDLDGKKHFVRRGDNLWNICKRYYGDPWYYPHLAELNKIKNPRLIHAGQTIIIPAKSQVKRWDFSR